MEAFYSITVVFYPCYNLSLLTLMISGEMESNQVAVSANLKNTKDKICMWYDDMALNLKNSQPAHLTPETQKTSWLKIYILGLDQDL